MVALYPDLELKEDENVYTEMIFVIDRFLFQTELFFSSHLFLLDPEVWQEAESIKSETRCKSL